MKNVLESISQRDLVAEAQAIGSKATTRKGAVRALCTHLQNRRRVGKSYNAAPLHTRGLRFRTRTVAGSDWGRSAAKRKADPEAKRARDDARYRKPFLAGLTRRETALLKHSRTVDGLIKIIADKASIAAELATTARLRGIATGKPADVKKIDISAAIVVPTRGAGQAESYGVKISRKGKDWAVKATLKPSYLDYESGFTTWKNGKPKNYTRTVCDNYVRSFAVIIDSQTIEGIYHNTRYNVTLLDDYAWSHDANGLKVYLKNSHKDDFHPMAGALLRPDAAEYLIRMLQENREKRLKIAAEQAALKAEMAGVYVCLADSLRAGNCRTGSLRFCERHNLNPSRHYTASEIIDIQNGDAGRARLAITAATLRHQREMAQGFATLADHRA